MRTDKELRSLLCLLQYLQVTTPFDSSFAYVYDYDTDPYVNGNTYIYQMGVATLYKGEETFCSVKFVTMSAIPKDGCIRLKFDG